MATPRKKTQPKTPAQIPMCDAEELTSQVKAAIANGDPIPVPKTFCYINDNQEVIEVTTTSGHEKVIGCLDSTKCNSARNGKVKVATMEIIRQGMAQKAFENGQFNAGKRLSTMSYQKIRAHRPDLTPTKAKVIADGIVCHDVRIHGKMNMAWALRAMPNGIIYPTKDGEPIHPDWIFITQDHSMYAIQGRWIYAIYIDHGIMRYADDDAMHMLSGHIPVSIVEIINYWTQEMVVPDDDDDDITATIIGYAKVPKSRMTRIEQKLKLEYFVRRMSAITEAISDPFSEMIKSMRKNLYSTINGYGYSEDSDDLDDDD